MKKLSCIIVFLLLLFFTVFSLPSVSSENKSVIDALQLKDYEGAAKLLEKQIEEMKNSNINDFDSVKKYDLYRSYFALAYIYAWRLNKKDKSLSNLQEVNTLKTKINMNEMPNIEFLYMAEIYEKMNETQTSGHYYYSILRELVDAQETSIGSAQYVMNEELIKFISFKLDKLKFDETKTKRQLLKKIKLTSVCMNQRCWAYMLNYVVPNYAQVWNEFYPDLPKISLSSYIRQSANDFGAMMLNVFFILEAQDKSIDEASKALEIFIDKYPDNYFTMSLIYSFFTHYTKNKQQDKALKLKSILENINKKRQVEIITEPDKRFSSPQKTWKIYQSALASGNIKSALECVFPAKRRERKEIYILLGLDYLKKDAGEPSELLEESRDEFRASYNINKKNQKVMGYVTFINSDGEWLIYEGD